MARLISPRRARPSKVRARSTIARNLRTACDRHNARFSSQPFSTSRSLSISRAIPSHLSSNVLTVTLKVRRPNGSSVRSTDEVNDPAITSVGKTTTDNADTIKMASQALTLMTLHIWLSVTWGVHCLALGRRKRVRTPRKNRQYPGTSRCTAQVKHIGCW